MPGQSETLETLRGHAEAIKGFGATSLYVYGSAARDEMNEDSDVDVFIDYDEAGPFSFVELIGLQEFLASQLKRDVDLTTRGGLHPRLKARIERSSIRVF